jgi:hypothetical protein
MTSCILTAGFRSVLQNVTVQAACESLISGRLPFVCSEVQQVDTLNAQELLAIDANWVEFEDGPQALPCETRGSVTLACGKQAAATQRMESA